MITIMGSGSLGLFMRWRDDSMVMRMAYLAVEKERDEAEGGEVLLGTICEVGTDDKVN